MSKTKSTFYLDEEDNQFLDDMYVKNIQKKNKTDKSQLISMAIKLLHQQQMKPKKIEDDSMPNKNFKYDDFENEEWDPQEGGEVFEKLESRSIQKGLPSGWIRATFIINEEVNDKIKAVAYWERLTVKDVMNKALTQYLQGKNIKPIPKP